MPGVLFPPPPFTGERMPKAGEGVNGVGSRPGLALLPRLAPSPQPSPPYTGERGRKAGVCVLSSLRRVGKASRLRHQGLSVRMTNEPTSPPNQNGAPSKQGASRATLEGEATRQKASRARHSSEMTRQKASRARLEGQMTRRFASTLNQKGVRARRSGETTRQIGLRSNQKGSPSMPFASCTRLFVLPSKQFSSVTPFPSHARRVAPQERGHGRPLHPFDVT
jgi:hypothetical protein